MLLHGGGRPATALLPLVVVAAAAGDDAPYERRDSYRGDSRDSYRDRGDSRDSYRGSGDSRDSYRGGGGRGGGYRSDDRGRDRSFSAQQRRTFTAKPGDWGCTECGAVNFARRTDCYKCSAPKGDARAVVTDRSSEQPARDGDWECSCGFVNFARRGWCRSCNEPRPEGAGEDSARAASEWAQQQEPRVPVEKKAGDWDCSCGAVNFSRRTRCFVCNAPKGDTEGAAGDGSEQQGQQGGEGDWVCTCGYTNFARRSSCRGCDAARPAAA